MQFWNSLPKQTEGRAPLFNWCLSTKRLEPILARSAEAQPRRLRQLKLSRAPPEKPPLDSFLRFPPPYFFFLVERVGFFCRFACQNWQRRRASAGGDHRSPCIRTCQIQKSSYVLEVLSVPTCLSSHCFKGDASVQTVCTLSKTFRPYIQSARSNSLMTIAPFQCSNSSLGWSLG